MLKNGRIPQILIFKRPVLQQFRVQAAVRRMIDILKKQAIERIAHLMKRYVSLHCQRFCFC